MSSTDQIEEIITSALMGSSKPAEEATREIIDTFILVPRSALPEVQFSDRGNGLVTALAQERFQPALRLDQGELNTGEWSRQIAYANLAVAEAIETGSTAKRRQELALDIFGNHHYPSLNVGAKSAIDRIISLEASK